MGSPSTSSPEPSLRQGTLYVLSLPFARSTRAHLLLFQLSENLLSRTNPSLDLLPNDNPKSLAVKLPPKEVRKRPLLSSPLSSHPELTLSTPLGSFTPRSTRFHPASRPSTPSSTHARSPGGSSPVPELDPFEKARVNKAWVEVQFKVSSVLWLFPSRIFPSSI